MHAALNCTVYHTQPQNTTWNQQTICPRWGDSNHCTTSIAIVLHFAISLCKCLNSTWYPNFWDTHPIVSNSINETDLVKAFAKSVHSQFFGQRTFGWTLPCHLASHLFSSSDFYLLASEVSAFHGKERMGQVAGASPLLFPFIITVQEALKTDGNIWKWSSSGSYNFWFMIFL